MQRLCATCGCLIDRQAEHFQDDDRQAFYCLKCGCRRIARATESDGLAISVVMFALFILLLIAVAIVAIF